MFIIIIIFVYFREGNHKKMSSTIEKPKLNICVVGSPRSGKSTLMGQLILLNGAIDERQMKIFETEAKKRGKANMKYAWISDCLKDEREQRVVGTVKCHTWKLRLAAFGVIITDTPGRKKYLKNIITGVQNADLAIVAVSSIPGDLEKDLGTSSGFLRDIILLLYSLGVKQLVVAVTKMDDKTVAYNWDRFNEIKRIFLEYSTKVGFSSQGTTFVPVSGWVGDNITQRSPRMPWDDGPTLVGAINNAEHPHRQASRPLRLPIQESHLTNNYCIVVGRVECGSVAVGDTVQIIIPKNPSKFSLSDTRYKISSIECHHTSVSEGKSGDVVGICVTPPIEQKVPRGTVIVSSSKGYKPPEVIDVQLLVLRTPGCSSIRIGYQPILSIHSAHVRCSLEDISVVFDRDTAGILETAPTSLKAGDAAIAKIRIHTPTLIEPFYESPSTGRFILRDMNQIIAVGIVRSVA